MIYMGIHMVLAAVEVCLCWKVLDVTVLRGRRLERKEKLAAAVVSLLLIILFAQNRQIMFFSSMMFLVSIIIQSIGMLLIERKNVALIIGVTTVFYSVLTLLDFLAASVSMYFLGSEFYNTVFVDAHSKWQVFIFLFARIGMTGLAFWFCRAFKEKAEFEGLRWAILGVSGVLAALVFSYQKEIVRMLRGTREYAGKELASSLVLAMGILAVIVILALSNHIVRSRYQYLEMKEELVLEQYQRLEQEMERNRCMVHDMRHDTLALYEYAKQQDYRKLQNYLENMLDEFPGEKKEMWTQNSLWDLIIQQKKETAEKLGIQVEIERELVSQFPFTEREGCAVFGNLLDNAIEACGKVRDGEKRISVRIARKNAMLFLKIGNSVVEKPKMKNGKPVTEKSGNLHGYGLRSVEKIVEKYEGTMVYDVDGEWFSVSVSFFNNAG